MDGKEVRGAGKQGKPLMLVSLVRHESAAVLAQQAVDRKTNEITVAPELLADRDLTGTVTTMDALLTQRQIAEQILAQHGDYLMVVKRNQPSLHEAIEFLFTSPPLAASPDEYLRHAYTDPGHGRIDTYTLESSTALNDYLDWPQVGQVFAANPTLDQHHNRRNLRTCYLRRNQPRPSSRPAQTARSPLARTLDHREQLALRARRIHGRRP